MKMTLREFFGFPPAGPVRHGLVTLTRPDGVKLQAVPKHWAVQGFWLGVVVGQLVQMLFWLMVVR